jgi:hypothetical protein
MCVVGDHKASSSNTKTITIWAQMKKRREAVSSAGKGLDFRAIVIILAFHLDRGELKSANCGAPQQSKP